jgi:beta-lactamase class A
VKIGIGKKIRGLGIVGAGLLAAATVFTPMPHARAGESGSSGSTIENAFDKVFTAPTSLAASTGHSAPVSLGAPVSAARIYQPVIFTSRIAALANPRGGRIGVAAIDLTTGRGLDILGDQPFPMASTVKIAIVATFLEGVDRGLYNLSSEYPLLMPVPSHKFDGPVAPVRAGPRYPAVELIELALTRSDNHATDALLRAVGGPRAVNAWLHRTGNTGLHIDRDIATLVRDDGAVNPAVTIDRRDSATPLAMVQLLAGLYRGQWLSPSSQQVLLGAMGRCITGRHRMVADLPEGASVAHKTGTLNNTASDVGIITMPDGRAMAVAIYVTGQGSGAARNVRIAQIARGIYEGYAEEQMPLSRTASAR